MNWTQINDEQALETALAQAHGTYQRDLLLGHESLSGSTLRGKARSYGARYAESRAHLLERVRRAGVAVSETRGPRGKRILVIG